MPKVLIPLLNKLSLGKSIPVIQVRCQPLYNEFLNADDYINAEFKTAAWKKAPIYNLSPKTLLHLRNKFIFLRFLFFVFTFSTFVLYRRFLLKMFNVVSALPYHAIF